MWLERYSTALLAQTNVIRGVGQKFRLDGPVWDAGDYVRVVGLGLAAFAVYRIVRYALADRGARPPDENPRRLFADLCLAHDLSRAEQRLLKALAERRGLATPSLLFVEPTHFDVADLDDAWRPHAEQLATLRRLLFTSPEEYSDDV